MKCPFCDTEFREEEARRGCSGCSMTKGCQMVRCPRCGYEIPPEPGWIKRLKGFLKKSRNP